LTVIQNDNTIKMRILIVLTILFLSYNSKGQDFKLHDSLFTELKIEEIKTYYDSGQLKSTGHYVNNLKEGV